MIGHPWSASEFAAGGQCGLRDGSESRAPGEEGGWNAAGLVASKETPPPVRPWDKTSGVIFRMRPLVRGWDKKGGRRRSAVWQGLLGHGYERDQTTCTGRRRNQGRYTGMGVMGVMGGDQPSDGGGPSWKRGMGWKPGLAAFSRMARAGVPLGEGGRPWGCNIGRVMAGQQVPDHHQ